MKVKGIAKLLSVVMTLTCISFPAVANAADETAAATSVVKEDLYINGTWGDYVQCYNHGVGGDTNGSLDYDNGGATSKFEDNTWIAQINDNTLTEDQLVDRTQAYYNITWDPSCMNVRVNPKNSDEVNAAGMIEPVLGWGYRGFKTIWNSDKTDNKYPAGTTDVSSYVDNGYVYYNINLEGQDLTDVYLTIGYHNNLWNVGYWAGDYANVGGTKFDDATVEKLEAVSANWQKEARLRSIRLRGVAAADYYDLEKGGFQAIKIPFSDFAAADVPFRKSAGKIDGFQTNDDTTEFNPSLVSSVGIARKDAHNGVNFTSKIKEVKFLAVDAPTGFEATPDTDGHVEVIWNAVNTDVTYQLKKTVDGVVSYIDLTDAEGYYYDEDVDTNNKEIEVKYAVVAKNTTYDISAETEEVVINKAVATTALKDKVFIPNNWGDTMQTFAYAVGWATEWLDYKNDIGSSFANGVWSARLDDNTYTEDQLVKRSDYVSGATAGDVYANPHTDESAGMIEQVTGWGYRGFAPVWNSNLSDAENKYPAQIMDLREYADNGSIAYTINVEDQNIDDVYLTIGTYKDLWDLGWYWEGTMADTLSYNSTALDVAKLDEIKAPDGKNGQWRKGTGSYRTIRLAGVPLKNYYDVEKGGFQTINVPLSDFVTKSTFKKMAGKIKNGNNILQPADDELPVNLGLVRTIGIARKDSHEGVQFTSQIKDIAIVAPSAVRDFTGTYDDATGAVNLTWKASTDSDIAKVELIKSVNGVKTVVDASNITSYSDTLDPASNAEVRYSVVVTDSKYGVTASSNEFIVNEREETDPVKEAILADGIRNANVESFTYAVGNAACWLDFSNTGNSVSNGVWNLKLNDFSLEQPWLRGSGIDGLTTDTQKENAGWGPLVESNPRSGAENMIDYATKWGYRGMRFKWSEATGRKYSAGILDTSAYADNGAVAYSINAEGQNLDNVYLTLGFYNNIKDIGFYDWNKYHTVEDKKSLDDATVAVLDAGDATWYKGLANDWSQSFVGVPIKDYYDAELGGYQTIVVPFSDFENSQFNKSAGKTSSKLSAADHSYKLNPALLRSIGVARKDSGTKAVNFTADINAVALVSVSPAEDVTVTKTANGAKITWLPSTDKNTTQKLVKIVDRQEQLIDVTGNEYVDTTVGANDEVSYYILTTDSKYGATAKSNKAYYNVPEDKAELKLDFKAGTSKDNDNLGKDENGNVLDAKPVAWYTGANQVSEWGEYSDYWNGRQKSEAGVGRYAQLWIVDNNCTHAPESYINNVGRILKDAPFKYYGTTEEKTVSHEYGLAGYEFNENVGTIKDISDCAGGYLVMNVRAKDVNGGNLNLNGSYITVEFAKSPWDIAGATSDEWTYGAKRLHKSIVRGVPMSDYYDASKGGFQTIMVPLSAFTNAENPEMKYVKVRENEFAGTYADDLAKNYDFANYMMAFKGAGFARKNLNNQSGVEFDLKDMYIINTAAPRDVKAEYNNGDVTVTWKEAPVDGASTYEVYRDNTKIATVDALTYTDVAAPAGEHTYSVKTVSPTYEGKTSGAASAMVTVPVSTEIKLYAGTGTSREETAYVVAGTMEVDFTSFKAGTQGYAAVYDANGVLKAVKTVALGSTSAKTIILTNVAATDTVKGFIWNNKMVPECDELVAGTRGTRVLTIGDEISLQSIEYLGDIAEAEGKDLAITSIYVTSATMHDHYANMNSDKAVYTKVVDGVEKAGTFSINDIIEEGDWDFVILQDKNIYLGLDDYYAEGGAAETEVSALVSALRETSSSAKIYANESMGYDETWAAAQEGDLGTFLADVPTWSDSLFYTAIAASVIATYTDSVMDILPAAESDYIAGADLASYYAGDGGEATFIDGQNLTVNGKFASSMYVYRAIANGAVVEKYTAPAGVTDAEGILAYINTVE